MKASELRAKDVAALEKEISDLLKAHFSLRMQKATQQLANNTLLGKTVAQRALLDFIDDYGDLCVFHRPDTAVIALYHDTLSTERRTYSLRSRPGGPDCARLAAQLGGGGHPNAAGFTLAITHGAYVDLIAGREIHHPIQEAA